MHLTEYKYLIDKPLFHKKYHYFAGTVFYASYDAEYYAIRTGKATAAIFDDIIKHDRTGNLCKKIA